MRHRIHSSAFLWSGTALGAMLVASSANAQSETASPNAAATAQQNPAQPVQNADAPQAPAAVSGTGNPDQSSIVVTGLRRSLQSARNIKRNSDQIVDAVVADDIGKLPDITVSDTAARIPGIQVERAGGEANRVLLRGLDNTYYTTTYNGREIFTAETRSVALQDFPAGAIAAVEAFKTSTSNLVEPGIAGLLNVRSRRPFDFEGSELSGSVWALHPNQSRDTSINGNLLLSDRWETGSGAEFGALVNLSYTRLHYKDSVRRHGFFIANLDGLRSPDWPEIHYNEGDRWRPSANAALQFRNGPLELYAEGLWQGYRERVYDRMWAQPLWNGGQAVYSNIQLRPGTNDILSGTVQDPGAPGAAWGFKGATHRETNTYQFAAGGSYDAGPLHVTADLARTYTHFQLRTESVDEQIANNNYSVNWNTGYPGGPGPTFQVVGVNPSDPSIYQYRGFFEDYQDPKGKDWQGRLDFDFDPKISFLPKVQWGVRYTDRDASDTAGSFYWNAAAAGKAVPITQVPLIYALGGAAFRGDDMKPFPIDWLTPTYSSIWSNLVAFRKWNIGLLGYGSADGPPVDPGRSFDINEKTLAGYGQLNFRVGGSDTFADGILGLRVVQTKDDINGTQFAPNLAPSPVNFRNKYTDWLPNLNINVHMGRPWVLRLAATKTITRPTYQELNPSLHLDQPPGCAAGVSNCFRTGSGGNPFLKPLRSNNYDASLEYYFSGSGYATVGVFRRDMRGFILNRTFQYPNPDPATGLPLLISGPVNSQKARLQGAEAQIRTFFDWSFLPDFMRSFGFEANVSYIDAKALQDVPGGQRNLTIPDVSKWTWNLTGMYERGPLSVRLSYNLRSRYPEGGLSLQGDNTGGYTLQGHAHQSPRLDLSASYNLNDNITFFADWTNILGHPFQSDIVRVNYGLTPNGTPVSTEVFPMVIRYEETIVSGGIRFNFAGHKHAPVVAPPMMAPPPPAPPPPAQPAPPPPPAPAPTPERGF
ncbi:MAG TPA: TonB-dependent receptor [Sphingomicrobium sp.]|nr:TonB-dependent receptor [Sphingomicrobium sp.]